MSNIGPREISFWWLSQMPFLLMTCSVGIEAATEQGLNMYFQCWLNGCHRSYGKQ